MSENLTEDNEIIWLAITKVGSPPAWQANWRYKLGDVVVPTNPQVGQENLAFQCVGFLGKSSSVQPAFTTTVGNTTEDNQIEWRCADPDEDPLKLKYDQYYLISQSVTVSL